MKRALLILALAAGAVTAVYATQRAVPAEPLPAVQGEVPRIVIVAKREHVADRDR